MMAGQKGILFMVFSLNSRLLKKMIDLTIDCKRILLTLLTNCFLVSFDNFGRCALYGDIFLSMTSCVMRN